jgi:hypothetical protein
MLNANAIYRMLIEGEVPPSDLQPPPIDSDDEDDVALALDRYLQAGPPALPGSPVYLYQDWKESLRGRRSIRVPSIRSTCYVDIPEENAVGLKYHNTIVVWVDQNNNVVVTTGGWKTRTTLERINSVAPGGWKVYGRKSRDRAHDDWDFYWHNTSIVGKWNGIFPFSDGDVIKADGTLYPQAQPEYGKK